MKRTHILLLVVLGVLLAVPAGALSIKRSPYTIEPPVSKGYEMPYTLTVYLGNQMVVAYDGQTQEPVRYMICSSGKGNITPRGTFTMPATYTSGWDRWGGVYVRYPTRIKGPYYFHSILYNASDKSLNMESWRKLGTKASHGCIRMTPLDAQWINYNCKKGTRIRIVNDRAEGLKDIHDRIRKELDRDGHSSVQPTLKPTPTPPPPIIEPGSTATVRIKSLQKQLRQRGFYNGPMSGNYEGATIAAWNAYQKAKGWAEDSIATTEEQTEMASDEETVALNVDLVSGDTGPIVFKVETRLKELGFFAGTPNKTYDQAAVTAVKKYQLAAGHTPANGKLLSSQQPELFSVTAPTPTPKPPLRLGSNGSEVKALQQRLYSLGFYAGAVTGKYQASTAQAVSDYQAAIGAAQTGEADSALQARIAGDNAYVGAARSLKVGSKGIVVKALEQKLSELGYFQGVPDNAFNAETSLAVKKYQKANALAQTGTVTRVVLKQILGL